MKYINHVFWLSFFLVWAGTSLAQETKMAAPLEHEHRMYVNENHQVFITPDTPIYIRIAASPNAEDPSFLMVDKKSQIKSIKEKKPIIALPIFVEGRGKHTIIQPNRPFWQVGMKSQGSTKDINSIMYIYADDSQPKSTINFTPSPRKKTNKFMVFGEPIALNFEAIDNGMSQRLKSWRDSGVRNIYFSVNGHAFQPYTNAVPISAQEEINIRYYAVDNVGNAEQPNHYNLALDLTPPISSHEVSLPRLKAILSPKTRIKLSSKDDYIGVASIHYSFDQKTPGEFSRYKNPILLNPLTDGEHNLKYRGIDGVANTETAKEYSFYLDKFPPDVSFSVIGDQAYTEKGFYLSQRSKVKLEATDNKSGLRHISYYFDSAKNKKTYRNFISIPNQNGNHQFYFNATDKVFNVSQTKSRLMWFDFDAPTTKHLFKGPLAITQDSVFTSSKTKLELEASDKESGVKQIDYSFDKKSSLEYYRSVFVPKEEGTRILRYGAIDRVNNSEKLKEIEFIVDNSSPLIFVHFSVGFIDSMTDQTSKEEIQVYPRNCMIFIGASDLSSGVDKIWFQLNNGKKQPYMEPLSFTKIGRFNLKVFVEDRVQNYASKSVEFAIQ